MTIGGKLAYTSPSIEDLIGVPANQLWQLSYLDTLFDGDYNIKTQISVITDGLSLDCAGSSACDLRYHLLYTPTLYDIIPSNVYNEQRVDFMLNPMATRWSINDDMEPLQEIRVGKTLVDWEGLIDSSTRTTQYTVEPYPARIGDQKPSKDSSPRVRFRVGDAFHRARSLHCLFDGSECWTIRTHPSIDEISKSEGFIAGGQRLKIWGQGLKGTGTDIQVTVDGVECEIKSVTSELIVCKTGETDTPSVTGVSQPSVPGLRYKLHDPDDESQRVYINTLTNYPVTEEGLLTSFETVQDTLFKAGRLITGYFKAPATGNFRFKLSCDDSCYLNLDSTPYNAASPVEPTYTEIA